MTESAYNDAVAKVSNLSVAELDEELEKTARTAETCEMLLCCYLAAMRERRGFIDFGYSNIYEYAEARFGFKSRKTRYFVYLGERLDKLPKLREALANGKLGWTKARTVARVAKPEDEATWVDSAIAVTVRTLENQVQDGTDAQMWDLRFSLNEGVRNLWENVLEIYRRRAGAEISPVQAFEYLLADAFAQECHLVADYDPSTMEQHDADDDVDADVEPNEASTEPAEQVTDTEADEHAMSASVFPWVEPIDTSAIEQGSLFETEHDAEKRFATSSDYNEVRSLVLERDGWQCTYPGCYARKNLEVHHVRFRSRGGPDQPWNLSVVCYFHHRLIHSGQIGLKGHAPLALEWRPPKLMREVLERRRNNPSKWNGELDIKEWTLDPAPVVT